MKKQKTWLLIMAACLLLASCRLAAAEVILTEVMYNPNQCSDTDCEWIEVYNNAEEAVELSTWKLNNRALEGTLAAKQYP